MEGEIRVLVADDHAVVRAGLARIIETEPQIKMVGEARDGVEAVNKARDLRPDVVLMDIFMPRRSGLEATAQIREALPQTRVLMLTVSEREEELLEALRLGAQGYLLKSATVAEVVEGIRKTAAGEAMLSPALVARLICEFRHKREDEAKLSAREMEVLELLGDGLRNTEIANRLIISESTVRTYLRRILDKLNLSKRGEAIAYANRHHLNHEPPGCNHG